MQVTSRSSAPSITSIKVTCIKVELTRMVCPISHIPIENIEHPVFIPETVTNRMIVYDAEHIVRWLKNHSLMDPVTHKRIRPDFAFRILRPTSTAMPDTMSFLKRAGYLDGHGGKVPSLS